MVGFPRGICLYICDRASAGTVCFCGDLDHGGTPYTRNDVVSILDWLIYLMPLIILVFLQIGAENCFSALFVAIDLFAQGTLVLGGLRSIIFVWFGPP